MRFQKSNRGGVIWPSSGPGKARPSVRWITRLFIVGGAISMGLLAPPALSEPKHAIAMHGAPAHGPDFKHFRYANPDAPKGGRITIGLQGSFDSLNPFIIKGTSARGLRDSQFGYNVYESLMARGWGEPFTLYGLLAKTIEVPDDRSWVEFQLNEAAKFSDGKPVTVDDVIFSLETLRKEGRYNHRRYYSKVVEVKRVPPRGVRLIFVDATDRELPLIMGLMPILPKHYFGGGNFNKTTLEPPIGSGPYRVVDVDPGAFIRLKRNPDYWGKDLGVKRGFDNFDEIKIEYYRTYTTLFEAFKKGIVDLYLENSPSRWSTGYDFPAVTSGQVVKEAIKTGIPKGMFALVFNTRRPVFADRRVRRALIQLFDFKWINKSLYHGLYRRTSSFFEGSSLASTGHPIDEREKALLAPFASQIDDKIRTGEWRAPTSDGSGRDRKMLRLAVKELAGAGYRISGGVLKNTKSGKPLTFEILVTRTDHQKIALSFSRTLRLLGITANVRRVDSVQYQRRRLVFDYDMIPFTWYASLSPGNEQLHRWSSASADQQSSFNFAGVKSKAVDEMINALLSARERPEFTSSVRALDRLLLSGYYGIPLFHVPDQWVARWTRVSRPDVSSLYGVRTQTWWATK